MDFKPMNCKAADSVADAAALCQDAVLEVKLDGWRAIVIVGEDGPVLYSRTGHVYTDRVPEHMVEFAKLPVGTIIDGEILEPGGSSHAVSNVLGSSVKPSTPEARDKLVFFAFDLLAIGQQDATQHTLRQRREALAGALTGFDLDFMRVVINKQHPATQEAYDEIVASGEEGVVVKCLESKYAKGKRGHGWYKIKATTTVDVVVMDLPKDGKGQYVGQVGRMVVGQWRDGALIERAKVNAPNQGQRRDMTDNPDKYIGRVAEIKHYGVTIAEGTDVECFRHPTFLRWREDKLLQDCDYDNG